MAVFPKAVKSFFRKRNKKFPLAEVIPLEGLVDSSTMRVRGGTFCQTFEMQGVPYDCTSDTQLCTWGEALSSTLLNVARALDPSYRLSYFTYVIRSKVKHSLGNETKKGFGGEVERLRQRAFDRDGFYVNRSFFTIALHTQLERQGETVLRFGEAAAFSLLGRLGLRPFQATARFAGESEARHTDFEEVQKTLRQLTNQVFVGLRDFGPRLLGIRTERNVSYSEVEEMWARLLMGRWSAMPISAPGSFVEKLTSVEPEFHAEEVEFLAPSDTHSALAATLVIRQYPLEHASTVRDELMRAPWEGVLADRFDVYSHHAGDTYLRDFAEKSAHFLGKDWVDPTINERIKRHANGEICIGTHQGVILVSVPGRDRGALDKAIAKIDGRFQERGFQVKLVNPLPAYLSMFPGNEWFTLRPAPGLSNEEVADIVSFHNLSDGRREAHFLGGPLGLFRRSDGGPFEFTPYAVSPSDVAYTLITGLPGTGKTTLVSLLALQLLLKGVTVVAYDHNNSMELLVRVTGGTYFKLHLGERTGWNPFQRPMTETRKQFAYYFVKAMLESGGNFILNPHQEKLLRTAIESTANLPERSLQTVQEYLNDKEMQQYMEKWTTGQFGWAFNAPWVPGKENDTIDYSLGMTGFNLTDFLKVPGLREITVMYLKHREAEYFSGERPGATINDEFQHYVDFPGFLETLEEKVAASRKHKHSVYFVTSMPKKVVETKRGARVFALCVTRMSLADPDANDELYVNHLGYTPTETWRIRGLNPRLQQFLKSTLGENGVVLHNDLWEAEHLLPYLASHPEDVELLDRIRSECGSDDPIVFRPLFERARKERR
jgi:type IV secretion system protein VirB4